MKSNYPNWPFLLTKQSQSDPMPSIMNDRQIRKAAIEEQMIAPFVASQVRKNIKGNPIISYGLSSFGYDIRIGGTFKVFTNAYGTVVDPKDFDPKAMVTVEVDEGEPVIIPPNSFALGLSYEYFRIPRDVVTVCVGKSTYARCGIIVNVTPFEPEWYGYAVLEISNTTQLPAKVYAGEGIAQVLFFRGEPCEVSYRDKKGKYQDQQDIVTAKV